MTREEQVAMIKGLREVTGAGMMDCAKSLRKMDWDMDKAKEYLRIMPKGWNHIDYFGTGRADRISK